MSLKILIAQLWRIVHCFKAQASAFYHKNNNAILFSAKTNNIFKQTIKTFPLLKWMAMTVLSQPCLRAQHIIATTTYQLLRVLEHKTCTSRAHTIIRNSSIASIVLLC